MQGADDRDSALEETLESLDLPPEGVAAWLEHVRAFCDAHGGRRAYADLLALLDDCDRARRRGGPP
ncbi:MAG: hypothetical protein HY553_11760 [Elusimicrobia bacterium]|nr:hypothetical protein [Elusimicrobiota bacterium]